MPEQLSFAGSDDPFRPQDAVFFAIRPDTETALQTAQLAQRLRTANGLTGDLIQAGLLHITLLPVTPFRGRPERILAEASEAAATIAMPPFKLALDRAMSFDGKPNNHPFVLQGGDGLAGLIMLRRYLFTAIKKAGLGRGVQLQFNPHMTLLYDKKIATPQSIETISWSVQEFVLLHSRYGESSHEILNRWQLSENHL